MKHEPGFAFNMKTLNKVFAFLSVLFMISVVWIFLDDFMRPWKGFQIKSWQIEKEHLQKQVEKVAENVDFSRVESVKAAMEEAQKIVQTRSSEIRKNAYDMEKIAGKIYATNLEKGGHSAIVAETQFNYEMALEKGDGPKSKKLWKKLQKYKALFADADERLKAHNGSQKALKETDRKLKKELLEKEKELEVLTGALERIQLAAKKHDFNPITLLRNLPFVDFLDPTLKIEQVVLENYALNTIKSQK